MTFPGYPTLTPFPTYLLDEKMLQDADETLQDFKDFVSINAKDDTETGEKTVTIPFDKVCKYLLLIQRQNERIDKWMDVVLDLQDYITKSEAWSSEVIKKTCNYRSQWKKFAIEKLKVQNDLKESV